MTGAALEAAFRWVAEDDADYPRALLPLDDRPRRLCVSGQVAPDLPALAIVGSRRATAYGLRVARALGAEAARAGWVVVSGLARGIDAEAHRGCLEAGGVTWAVLGSGLERVYPPENRPLAERIVARGGCLLSEFPEKTPPFKGCFPARNRIVAGLCWATIVVEGRERSGSLITGRKALEYGREVFAVPGPVDSDLSTAPFILLRQGAQPLRTLRDAWPSLAAYGACAPSLNSDEGSFLDGGRQPSSLVERKILQYLGSDTRSLEDLGQAAALDIVRLSTILLDMELGGFIQSLPGQRYAKKGNEENKR